MAPATSFSSVVGLIRRAENALIKYAGQIDPQDRTVTMRGIFYGTEWSLDNRVESERKLTRNIGFLAYTGGNLPADPRPALGAALFADLQSSQSIRDGGRGIDIGHVLIGIETRASVVMRSVPLPGQGGSGIEIVTWLGDLGGGAANLAKRRATVPKTPVHVIFNNASSDYGVMDNLEGDVGGYLVASGTNPGGSPVFGSGNGVADALADYLPLISDKNWVTRAARFATAIGATVSARGITNSKTVIDQLTQKLYDFAVWYAATRWIPSGELLGKRATAACTHMRGAAQEVATVLVATLSHAITSPLSPIQAVGPYPNPTVPGTCESDLLNAASTDVSAVRKQLESLRRDLGKLFD